MLSLNVQYGLVWDFIKDSIHNVYDLNDYLCKEDLKPGEEEIVKLCWIRQSSITNSNLTPVRERVDIVFDINLRVPSSKINQSRVLLKLCEDIRVELNSSINPGGVGFLPQVNEITFETVPEDNYSEIGINYSVSLEVER